LRQAVREVRGRHTARAEIVFDAVPVGHGGREPADYIVGVYGSSAAG